LNEHEAVPLGYQPSMLHGLDAMTISALAQVVLRTQANLSFSQGHGFAGSFSTLAS